MFEQFEQDARLSRLARMAASFLQNLPTSGLLAQMSEKIVQRAVSLPRSWRH